MSSQSEVSNIQKSLPKIWFDEFFENNSPLEEKPIKSKSFNFFFQLDKEVKTTSNMTLEMKANLVEQAKVEEISTT